MEGMYINETMKLTNVIKDAMEEAQAYQDGGHC